MSDGFDSLDPVDDDQIRATGSAGLPRSYGDYLAASADEAFQTNPASLVIQYAQREWNLRQALADNPMLKPLDVETANARYGIEGQLKFDAPIYEIRARDMRARRATQLRNQEVFANPNVGTLGFLGGTAASFAVGATDPLNIASAFIPFFGTARAGQILGKAYMAGGRLGRTGAYAGMGAVEGLGGAAVLEPLNLALNPELGRDYTSFDTMVNLTFGGLLGAGLHAGTGYFYDRHMGKLMGQLTDSFKASGDPLPLAPAVTPPNQPTALHVASLTPEAQHTVLQTAVGQLVDEDGGGVNVVPLIQKIDQATAQRVATHEAREGDIPLKPIRQDEAITSTGRRVGVTYAIVEADSLRASQTNDLAANPAYPPDLQPRNRSKAASVAQIMAIEKDLQPELLGEQPQASDGAPIVTRQGAVLSGNARTIVLKRLAENYSEGNAERWGKYVDWLKSKGYDIEGFKSPVLVRVLTDDLASADVLAFTRESNVTGVATMSAGETAINDAKNIPDTVLALHQGGDFKLQVNRNFLMRLIESIVPTTAERAAMMTADGGLTFDGAKRVERAILARAFGDANLIQVLTENTDDSNIKTIGNSLTDVAPIWATMRAEARAGTIDPGVDSTNNLLAAVSLVRRARDEGRPVSDFVVHGDLLNGDINPITKAWLAVFYRNDKMTQATGREKLTEFLNKYAAEARKQLPGPNLLGDTNATPDQIISAVRENERRRTGSQAELFKPQPQSPDDPGIPLSPAEHPSAAGGPAGPAGGSDAAAAEPVIPPDSLIVNPLDPKLSPEEKVAALGQLTEQTKPIVDAFLALIDQRFGSQSKSNIKAPENILSKAQRPSILAKKPWHGVEHIRDSFRFKTVLDDMSQLPAIIQTFLDNGFEMVKPDTAKFMTPALWGWRIIVFDMRAPTGQLVEYYLPVPELEAAKQARGHHLFEMWRNHDISKLSPEEQAAYDVTINESRALYNSAFEAYKARTAQDDNALRAAISNSETTLSSRATKSSSISSTDLTPMPRDQDLPSQLAANEPSPTMTRGSEAARALAPNIEGTSSEIDIGSGAGKGNNSQGNDESGLPDITAQNQAIEAQIVELNRRGIVSDTDQVFAPLAEERLADRRSQALKAAGICLATSIGKAS